jgi:two-component system, NarL family, nitrate/nitrite response regulator NarL
MPIRLVLAVPQLLVLDAIEALLREAGEFEVVARCRDGEDAFAALLRTRPDVAVLDLALPGWNGLEVLRRAAEAGAQPRSVLLADRGEEGEAAAALRLGVGGLVLKEMPGSSLALCIRAVHAGEPWLERRSAARMIRDLVARERGQREAAGVLTPRELEVVRMVASGLRNRGIAARLGISESTVKAHLGHIYEKLGRRGRSELLRFALAKGLA